jgi:hypothetical protein
MPPEQREAELALQHLDLLAQGRLLHTESFRRPRHMARFGDRDKIAKMSQFHARMRPFTIFKTYR